MINLLIILPWLPYPCDTGGNQAVFNEIEAIRNDVNVHLMCWDCEKYREYKKILNDLWPNVTLDLYPKLSPRVKDMDLPQFLHKVVDKIEEKFCRAKSRKYQLLNEMSINTNYEGKWQAYIETLVKKYNIDIIQTEFVNALGAVIAMPDNVKKVFVHHELRWVRNGLLLSREPNSRQYLPYKKNIEAQEIGLCNLYDAVITLSSVDREKLIGNRVATPIYSSFAIVQNKYEFKPVEHFDNRLTFVGPENHQPNKNGLDWFLENVWDKVLILNPKMRLDVIGNWTALTKELYEHKYRNLHFLGFVDNLQEALTGSIMIVPILVGSGIRMKIQEAANMGVPFVTTSVGVEGLPFRDNIDCYIRDDVDEFVNAIIALQNNDIQKLFTCSACELIRQTYSLGNLQKNRLDIYYSLMKK